METYNDIYIRVRRALKSANFEAPETEAKFIVAGAAGITREKLLAMNKLYATDESMLRKIDESLERRLKGEPLAYILGTWEFLGYEIMVNKHVLIPRSDTEILAAEAIKLTSQKMWKTRVLDICTGSGCIGIAIALKVQNCHVVLADKGEEVLAVCRQNVKNHNLSRNTAVVEADALKAPPALFGAFDVIVSNPPYIPSGDIDGLDSSVKDYEPIKALDGGRDGMDYFRIITEKWTRILKPGGNLAFECGTGQADEVQYIMKQNGLGSIKVYKDTQGIDRAVTGKKG